MIYLRLFLSFLQIGAFSFGGGYAAMPMIYQQVVYDNKWLSTTEFSNLITISQMTPGPIAVNSATFVGLRIAGIPGAVIATIGCILPSCIFVTVLAHFYLKYRKMSLLQDILSILRPIVIALIATAGVQIYVSSIFKDEVMKEWNWYGIRETILFLVALLLIRFKKMNPVLVMLLAGMAELVYFVLRNSLIG